MKDNVKYPNGETVWVSYCNSSGDIKFILTSKPSREFYFLYKVFENGSLEKLGKAKSPTEIEEKFNVYSTIRQ